VSVNGGEKFEAAIKDLSAKMAGGSSEVRIGFLENASYPDGKKVAFVAAMNEYGHNIVRNGKVIGWSPARPFFRNMIAAKKGEWPSAMGTQLKANNYDVAKTLDVVGTAVAGQLRQSIVDTNSPPNAPSTIARKGFDKPLVDTGHMLNSVDYEIADK
jgi:hypothetical protein